MYKNKPEINLHLFPELNLIHYPLISSNLLLFTFNANSPVPQISLISLNMEKVFNLVIE